MSKVGTCAYFPPFILYNTDGFYRIHAKVPNYNYIRRRYKLYSTLYFKTQLRPIKKNLLPLSKSTHSH